MNFVQFSYLHYSVMEDLETQRLAIEEEVERLSALEDADGALADTVSTLYERLDELDADTAVTRYGDCVKYFCVYIFFVLLKLCLTIAPYFQVHKNTRHSLIALPFRVPEVV